jgi:Carboxypeptidase regulatory-like domain
LGDSILLRFRLRLTVLFLLVLSSGLKLCYAQANATLEGYVLDPAGSAIPNAEVDVENTTTGIVRKTQSDSAGRYIVNALIPASYQVTTSASGFTNKVLTGIILAVGADQRLDVTLAIGQQAQTVSVQAVNELVDTETSSNGTVVDNKKVVELPLANRQFYSLALLSPAAYPSAQNSTLGFRGGFNIAGVSEISNQFTINGTFDNDMGVAQPSFRPSVEAIQEFKLLTGVYSAEYGRMSGGQLLIVTKSGTNQFHGVAYEFLRNQITDAKPFFNPAGAATPAFRQNTFGGTIGGPIRKDRTFFFFAYEGQRIGRAVTAQATVPTTAMLQGQFPGSEKLFNPATGAPLTPNPSTNTYDLTQLPMWKSTGAQAGQLIAKLGYPAPNINTTSISNNYAFSETRIENMNEESLRIDHKLSDKDSLYGSWNYFRDPAFEPSNSLCSSYVLPNFGCFTNQHSTLANVVWDRVFSSTLLNEVRLGFQRLVQPRVQQDSTSIGVNYPGLPGGPYFTQAGYANNLGLPNTIVSGYSTIGGATNLPQDRWDNHYQIVDVLTWTHGAHTIKTGVDLLLAKSTNIITSSGRGAFNVNDANLKNINGGISGFTGDSMADLLLGVTYTSSIGTTAPTVYLNYQSTHLFVQDDWKFNQYLTLNLGLRWELDAPVYTPNGTASNFNIATQQFTPNVGFNLTTQKLVNLGPSINHLYNFDYNNFAPRVGFSWQPLKKDTTVLKGAFGIFYNAPLLYNQFLTNGTQAPFRYVPTYTSTKGNDVNLGNPFPASTSPTSAPCTTAVPTAAPDTTTPLPCASVLSALSIAPHYATPYITEWSLGVEQMLNRSLVLETTYFGSKGTRLPLQFNLNQVNIGAYPAGPAPTQTNRPFAGYSTVNRQDTINNSEYQSLQASLRQSYTNGVSFLLAYTFGKSIDGGGGIGSGSNSSGIPQNVYNLRAERGLSDFNVAHRVVFSPVAELPFGKNKPFLNHGFGSVLAGGWQLASIFSFQTGRPFTVTDAASNNSGSFQSGDRPNVIANPNAAADTKTGAPTHTVKEWFNVNAFQLAPSFSAAKNGLPATQGQFGNSGRNTVIGPRYTDIDLTLSRSFPIYERFAGQFRADAFNVLNHPNFFNPLTQGAQFGSGSAFGTVTQANDNREFQFSLRLSF